MMITVVQAITGHHRKNWRCFVVLQSRRWMRWTVSCWFTSFSSTKGLEKLTNQLFTQFLNFIATPTGRVMIVGNTRQDWKDFLQDQTVFSIHLIGAYQMYHPVQLKRTHREKRRRPPLFSPSRICSSIRQSSGCRSCTLDARSREIGIESNIQASQFNANTCRNRKKVASGGSTTLNLRQLGHKMIRFTKLQNSQATITRVERWNQQTNQYDIQANPKTAIVLTPGQNKTDKIKVQRYATVRTQRLKPNILSYLEGFSWKHSDKWIFQNIKQLRKR